MTFSSNLNNRQNENLPARSNYHLVGLSQPISIPPAPLANCSGTTFNYSIPQASSPGTPTQNWQAGIPQNPYQTNLRYSPAVPATQPGHKTHIHPGNSLTAPSMASPTRPPMHSQLDNWHSSDFSMPSPPTFLLNSYRTPTLSPSAAQHGPTSSKNSSADSTVEISMTTHENGSGAASRRGPEKLPIKIILAKKHPYSPNL